MKLPNKRLKKPMFDKSEWTNDDLQKAWEVIRTIGQKYGWIGYDTQFEIVSCQQMLEVHASIGLPINYEHWSFGQAYEEILRAYNNQKMNPAYECVINSNPSICYICEDNSLLMQLIVLAHAACGHNFVFKNNYLFKEKTDANGIVGFLLYAKRYIRECEEKYGVDDVELLLDACHALKHYSFSRFDKPKKVSVRDKLNKRREHIYKTHNPDLDSKTVQQKINKYLEEPDRYVGEENILYFLQKNGKLADWEREIVYIVRTINQYFYPQVQCKLLHEGFASFVHYTILNELYDLGYISEGLMHEFIHNHTSVVNQPDQPGGNPVYDINPYYLGFRIFEDIKRICTNPTDEDRRWFPELVNTDWVKAVNYAATNFKDDSLVYQYLSPHLARKLKLFSVATDDQDVKYHISAIHSDEDFKQIRSTLALQYDNLRYIPYFQVSSYDELDLFLHLHADKTQEVELNENYADVINAIMDLWRRGRVNVYARDASGEFVNLLNEFLSKEINEAIANGQLPFIIHLNSLRCKACDEELTDFEATAKNEQGEYEDLCKRCIRASEDLDVDLNGEDLGDIHVDR